MRFLFGDSTPFEEGYDALEALRGWVDASTDLLLTARAIEEGDRRMGKRTQEQLHGIEAVDEFFEGVIQRVAEQAARSGQPDLMAPHARDLVEHVTATAAAIRERSAAALDADQRAVADEVEGLASALSTRLGRYLMSGPLPLEDWELALSYDAERPRAEVALHYPEGLGARFTHELADDPTWGTPPRMRDVCADVVVEVGLKKAFLRSTLSPESTALDELHLMHLTLSETDMSLHLSRRPDTGETALMLEMSVADDAASASVRRGGDDEEPYPSPESDHASLRRLHEALRAFALPLTQREGVLTAVRIDDEEPPVRGDPVRAILDRIGARIAPTVMAVFEHSPNADELSLKREHDDGRREELYLRIDELQERLAELPDEERTLHEVIPFLVEARPESAPAGESEPSSPEPAGD